MRRLQRAVIAISGTALVGLVPLTGGSANADGSSDYVVDGTAPAQSAETRVGSRRVSRAVSIVFDCDNCQRNYYFKGMCPKCNTSRVILKRAHRYNGKYTKVRMTRTKANGWYTFRNQAHLTGRGWYKVYVPPTSRFAPANSQRICVDRGGCG